MNAGKLPNEAHTARPWRIHEMTRDFELLDVWALPTPGGPTDFERLVELVTSFDPARASSPAVRFLFDVRSRLGELLRWDDPGEGIGTRVVTLRDRLPDDLRESTMTRLEAVPFSPLYETEDEFAAEVANRTVHGVLHLGWVPDGDGTYRGQLAILVKTNGLLGTAYVTAIAPFRYLVVYPLLLKDIERAWGTGAKRL